MTGLTYSTADPTEVMVQQWNLGLPEVMLGQFSVLKGLIIPSKRPHTHICICVRRSGSKRRVVPVNGVVLSQDDVVRENQMNFYSYGS